MSPAIDALESGSGGKLFVRRDSIFSSAGYEDFFGRSAEDAIEGELSLRSAAQLKQQFAAIVGKCIHRVDKVHARGLIEVLAIGYILEQDKRIAVEIGLGDQGNEFLLLRWPIRMRGKDHGGAGAVSELKDAKLFVKQRSRLGRRRGFGVGFSR